MELEADGGFADDRLRIWRDDLRGAQVIALLGEREVDVVLIKGAALDHQFPAPRRYRSSDVDLFVAPADTSRAHEVLRGEGYEAIVPPGAALDLGGAHASVWSLPGDYFFVDLHTSLPEVDLPHDRVWSILLPHMTHATVAGTRTRILDRTATAALAALHAAHHRPQDAKPWDDLRRVISQLPVEEWRDVGELVVDLEATEPFGDALSVVEGGRTILEDLMLRGDPSPGRRIRWKGGDWTAAALFDVVSAPSVREGARRAARIVAPSPSAVRHHHPWAAERGLPGVAAAYVVRVGRLVARLPRAVVVLWRFSRRRDRTS